MSAEKHIRKILMGLLAVVLFCLPLASFAEDYETAHTFKPGEVISADVLNEMFMQVSPDLAKTIIGVWSTQCWDTTIVNADQPGEGVLTVNSIDTENSSTDITYSGVSCLSRTNADNGSPGVFGIVDLRTIGNKVLIVTHNSQWGRNVQTIPVLELTPNRIAIQTQNSGIEVLTRLSRVPNIPTDLSSATAGFSIGLTWTDTSNDETGFKILRKDSLEGEYNEIATTNANTTSFQNTLPSSGTYWYRVKATNEYGDSLGSNVVKVIVSEVKN